jgi:hypothetical protein
VRTIESKESVGVWHRLGQLQSAELDVREGVRERRARLAAEKEQRERERLAEREQREHDRAAEMAERERRERDRLAETNRREQ